MRGEREGKKVKGRERGGEGESNRQVNRYVEKKPRARGNESHEKGRRRREGGA